MLSEIVQLLRVLVWRLWRRRNHSAGKIAVCDSRNAADEAPSCLPTPNDNDSAESTDITDKAQSGKSSKEIQTASSGNAGSEKTLSDTPKDTLPKSDAKGQGGGPNGNADVGSLRQQDLTESLKGIAHNKPEIPKDNAWNQNNSKQRRPDIGGLRNKTKSPRPGNREDAKSESTPRPELICRKSPGSWEWEVVLTADNESNVKEVRQNGKLLGVTHGEYSLSSLAGSLSIVYTDGKANELPLCNDTPLIFKLPNDWDGYGRRVRGITSGHFIVIAPREWERRGNPPVKPAECTDEKMTVHFFYRRKDESKGAVGGFEGRAFVLEKSGFELNGSIIFDNSGDGELFVGDPPELVPALGVILARIGEERDDGWKGEYFTPAERTLTDVLNGREGRFFVRVYDRDGLRDSGQFRYLRDLREVHINGEPYSPNSLIAPPLAGHSQVELQFLSEEGAEIHPRLNTSRNFATTNEEGTIKVEPHPNGDNISCTLNSDTGSVQTFIRIPRIWWRLEKVDSEADAWSGIPLVMKPLEFREQAHAGSLIRLRLPRTVASVRVGFDDELGREYRTQRNRNDNETEIHLSDFVDYDQLGKPLNAGILLNVQCGEKVMALVKVLADAAPKITTFESEQKEIKIGEATTLHWTIRNGESDGVFIHISDGIGEVASSGRREVCPMETKTFILKLKAPSVDETKSVTVLVRNERGDNLLTLDEVKERLKGVDPSLMEEETNFSVVDLKRYWDGECHSGAYKSPDFDLPFFINCMSEYAIDRSKYKDRAKVRRINKRRRAERSR